MPVSTAGSEFIGGRLCLLVLGGALALPATLVSRRTALSRPTPGVRTEDRLFG